jgi:GH3 auxin-responsive promoter
VIDATWALRLYARHRLSQLKTQDQVAQQRRQLGQLVCRAAQTRFGRDHRFAKIRSVADFQARVPVRTYEEMWRGYWQFVFPRLVDCTWPGTIPFFALTSGTSSGATKYIPCSHEMTQSNGWAAIDLLVHHLANRPRSRVLGGKNFMLGGSTDLKENAPGIRSGDLSGIAIAEVPRWARRFCFPPPEMALIADWEEKIDRLTHIALTQDIRTITGTPSWLLIFVERLFALRPQYNGRLAAFFPNLELVAHGGVNFAPYRSQFRVLLQGGHAELREVYPASEGFIAVADCGDGEGMRLICDNGLFFEFVPVGELCREAPTRHWLGTVQTSIDYALVLSSNAGLWAYLLGDTVRFVDVDPPRILVTGRTSYFLSAFGEHLSGGEIELAVGRAADAIAVSVADFAVGAVFPDSAHRRGRHLFVVEFAEPAPDASRRDQFARCLDDELSRVNNDYRAHRAGGFGLDAPEIEVVSHGRFAAWMKHCGRLGGQHKVPRVIADPALLDELRRFMRTAGDD